MSTHMTIFGATSGIGQCAVEEALRRDHTVRAFARSAGDMPPLRGWSRFPVTRWTPSPSQARSKAPTR